MTWAILTPKEISKDSIVRKVAVGAKYVKPKSRKKSATIHHIAFEVLDTLVNIEIGLRPKIIT